MKADVARDFNRQSLRNALLITVFGDHEKAAIWCLVGGQTIRLHASPARMSCDDVLELVREEMLKEYKNLAHNRGLQGGDHGICNVRAGSDGEAFMDPAKAEVREGLNDDDSEDEPAETAVCVFSASKLHKRGNRGSWKPLQQDWKKGEKKDPH